MDFLATPVKANLSSAGDVFSQVPWVLAPILTFPPSPCSEALLLQFLEHSSTIHHTQVLQEPPTERELLSQCLEASCGKYYPTFLSVGSLVALKSSEAQRRFPLPRLAHPAFHNVLTAPHHGFNVCLSQSMCPVAGIRFILPFTDAESSHLLKPTGYKIDRTCRFISSRTLVSSEVRLLLQYSLWCCFITNMISSVNMLSTAICITEFFFQLSISLPTAPHHQALSTKQHSKNWSLKSLGTHQA